MVCHPNRLPNPIIDLSPNQPENILARNVSLNEHLHAYFPGPSAIHVLGTDPQKAQNIPGLFADRIWLSETRHEHPSVVLAEIKKLARLDEDFPLVPISHHPTAGYHVLLPMRQSEHDKRQYQGAGVAWTHYGRLYNLMSLWRSFNYPFLGSERPPGQG